MQTSKDGRVFIEVWEESGVPKLKAYDDGTGVWTIGFGHIDGVKQGDVCTLEQADVWLTADLHVAEEAVNKYVRVPLTQSQFDVLVSFTMNEGVNALATSTLLRELNTGNYADVPSQLQRWDMAKVGGGPLVVMQGLLNRRKAEGVVWVQGSPPLNPVQPDGSRTLNGAVVAAAGGLVTIAVPVQEAVSQAVPLWSAGTLGGIAVGLVILGAALWVAYARLDDAGLIPWNRKTPVSNDQSTPVPTDKTTV